MRNCRPSSLSTQSAERRCRQPYDRRSHQDERRILRLRTLSGRLFIGCVRRVQLGDSPKSVAIWLFAQPDRGGCQHLALGTLRVYLQVLRRRVLALDSMRPAKRRQVLHGFSKILVQERIHMENNEVV